MLPYMAKGTLPMQLRSWILRWEDYTGYLVGSNLIASLLKSEALYFNPILSGQGTDTLRRPTCRGEAKSKPEPQELCEQRREREISRAASGVAD